MGITEYKCPNCSGVVNFDSGTQKMKCPYCDAQFELDVLQAYQKELSKEKTDVFGWEEYNKNSGSGDWQSGELDVLASNSCPSCGAEIVGNKNTIATSCPYCGNTQIVQAQVKGMFKPDFVIPFKLDKNAAKEALEKFQNKKRLLLRSFKQQNRIDSITGIYIPFWLFDADADAQIRYKATKVRHWSTSDYDYTETNFYSCTRNGSMDFKKVPVDGSEKMDDAYMDSIEPFNYSDLKEFSGAYLSGYLAEKYDVDAEASKPRANERITKSIIDEFTRTVVGYTSVTPVHSAVQLKHGLVQYALFPVWMLNTKHKGVTYTFAMNGQTGKLIGKLPLDKGKYFASLVGITAVLSGIFSGILLILRNIL